MIEYTIRYLDDREILRRWMDPRVSSVRVAQIQAYLLRKGWKQVPSDRPHVLVFEEPKKHDDESFYQFVPDTEQRRDYPRRIFELLAVLAESENRYAGDVLSDILQHTGDAAFTNGPITPMTEEH
ncbi:MAG: hypothetical protein ACYC0H_22420, partial [Solirubrobacteraceae bacterium]